MREPSYPVASAIGTNYFNSNRVIKFVEEQICQFYGNQVRILSDSDPKFDSAAVRDYAAGASIEWNIISAYNTRGNARVERMAGTLKWAVQKSLVSKKYLDWDECLGEILDEYRRRPGTDENLLSKCYSESDLGLLLSCPNLNQSHSIPTLPENSKLQ